MTIYFDMDGTIADFYSVNNWLNDLQKEKTTPYEIAEPLVNVKLFSEIVNALKSCGYRIGIISWGSKQATREYNKRIKSAKVRWLKQHFSEVAFDEIHVIKYGTPKSRVAKDKGYLFDDEAQNRMEWLNSGKGATFDEKDLLKRLKNF